MPCNLIIYYHALCLGRNNRPFTLVLRVSVVCYIVSAYNVVWGEKLTKNVKVI